MKENPLILVINPGSLTTKIAIFRALEMVYEYEICYTKDELKDFKKLKIDQDFVREMFEKEKNQTIIASMIKLGHDLGLPVLAEGIETTEQKEWLEKNGCDMGQGFWFSRPLPLEQLLAFLQKTNINQ